MSEELTPEKLANRLEQFKRILEGARKHDNNKLNVWSTDPVLVGAAASALRRLAAAGEQKPVAWRILCTDKSRGSTGNYYTEQLPFEPGENIRQRKEPVPLYAAPQPAPGWDDAIDGIATAESMLSAHMEEFHDFEYEPHAIPLEVASLLRIQHHLAGSLIDKNGEALRSSQSTSDAGGGVREDEPIAFMFWNEPDTQRHFTELRESIGSHWSNVKPLYANPAAADSNASAEARLREALEAVRFNLIRAGYEPNSIMIEGIDKALSTHPHASDCDKTTYDVLGDQRTCVGVPASGLAKMMDAVENPKQPNEALKKLMRDHASDCDKQGER